MNETTELTELIAMLTRENQQQRELIESLQARIRSLERTTKECTENNNPHQQRRHVTRYESEGLPLRSSSKKNGSQDLEVPMTDFGLLDEDKQKHDLANSRSPRDSAVIHLDVSSYCRRSNDLESGRTYSIISESSLAPPIRDHEDDEEVSNDFNRGEKSSSEGTLQKSILCSTRIFPRDLDLDLDSDSDSDSD